MPSLQIENRDGSLELAYLEEGQGDPVLLVHGFASTKEVNWLNTGWISALAKEGFRAIALDNRGHGASAKPRGMGAYTLAGMADDAFALLAALDLGKAHVIGYSMGARIAATMAARRGRELERVVLSGNGWTMVDGSRNWQAIRDALLTGDPAEISDPQGVAFRKFAEQTGSDLAALADCASVLGERVQPADLAQIPNAVLVAIGGDDDLAGSGEKLASAMPHARYFEIPGRDHMRAVGDKAHITAALEFLRG